MEIPFRAAACAKSLGPVLPSQSAPSERKSLRPHRQTVYTHELQDLASLPLSLTLSLKLPAARQQPALCGVPRSHLKMKSHGCAAAPAPLRQRRRAPQAVRWLREGPWSSLDAPRSHLDAKATPFPTLQGFYRS